MPEDKVAVVRELEHDSLLMDTESDLASLFDAVDWHECVKVVFKKQVAIARIRDDQAADLRLTLHTVLCLLYFHPIVIKHLVSGHRQVRVIYFKECRMLSYLQPLAKLLRCPGPLQRVQHLHRSVFCF
jgi:hypothetical protein